MRVIGVIGRSQGFLRWELQVPTLPAQMGKHLFGVLDRQLALFVQLNLHHETQVAQQQQQRFGELFEAVTLSQPQITVGLAQTGVDKALHDNSGGSAGGLLRVAARVEAGSTLGR